MVTPVRVGIVPDFVEEGWPSMDLVANALLQELQDGHRDGFAVCCVRPQFVKRFSRLPCQNHNGAAPIADRIMNRFLDYPRFLKARKSEFDLFHIVDHSYSHLVPVVGQQKTVVSCHDLDAFRCITEKHNGTRSWALRQFTRGVLSGFQSAAAIACDSVTTRDEIVRDRLVPSERITVNPNGVARCFRPQPDRQADAEAARLLGSIESDRLNILHVGSTIPRKRIDIVLRSFAAVRRELPSVRLIRVGGAFTPSQRELMKELDLADAVTVLPFLTTEVLAAVYRRATVTMLPSQSEGFGLPVVESLACGTPVVLSDIPVFHEVAGDAANFCPASDIGAFTHATVNVIRERERLSKRFVERSVAGIAWAAQFTWERHAQRAALIYKELLNS